MVGWGQRRSGADPGRQRRALRQLSWATSFSHPLGESVDFYLEAFGEGPDEAGGHHFVGADTGLLYRLNDDLQIDAYYLRGLSSFGIDWQVGSGVSARF